MWQVVGRGGSILRTASRVECCDAASQSSTQEVDMLSAIILAGGRSSRMGTPKALLPFDEEPLILHIVRVLRPLFDEVVVVAAPGQRLPELSARIVHDEVGYQGPVGGICYGLRAAEGEFGFVTS